MVRSAGSDEAAFTDDVAKCEPYIVCAITNGPAYTEFPTNGDMIGAIAPADYIGIVGKLAHGEAGDPADYQRIEFEGVRYWIDIADLIPVADEDCKPPTDVDCPTYGWPERERLVPPGVEELAELRLSGDLGALRMIDEGDLDDDGRPDRPTTTECCVGILYETPDTSTPVMGIPFPAVVTVIGSVTVDNGAGDETWFITSSGDYFMDVHVILGFDCVAECPSPLTVPGLNDALRTEVPLELREARISEPLTYLPPPGQGEDCCIAAAYTGIDSGVEAPGDFPRFVEVASGPHAPAPGWYLTTDGDWFTSSQVVPNSFCERVDCPTPMDPGTVDLEDLRRGTEVETLALTLLFPGDTAECCATGDTYATASFDDVNGVLVGAVSVIVLDVEGDWYYVQVDDKFVWIHVSQFVDFGQCDSGICFDAPVPGAANEIREEIAECCIQGRVLTVHPTIADGGDFISIDPAVEGVLFEVIDDFDDSIWYGFTTVEYGNVWAVEDWIVDDAECDPVDVECPRDSFVGTVIIDGEELVQCCVAFNSAAAGPGFKVVTLTGETEEVAGVVTYFTTDGESFIDSEFANAGRCLEVPCPDGSTAPTTADCPPPGVRCPDGSTAATIDDCPPPRVNCPNGGTAPTIDDCPPPRVNCPDGSTAATIDDCPPPTTCDDTDNDGWCDESDNCVFNPNPGQEDADNDGRGDLCDDCPEGDFDGDGICDNQDNCPETPNPGQRNSDGDGVGDACDNCPLDTNGFQFDDDGDGIGNECDQPDCPEDRITSTGLCCPAGSSADGPECYCFSGPEVRPGGECPPPCPQERQIPGGGCCPEGTTAGSVDCFCPDGSISVPGQTCPPTGVLVQPEGCPADRLRGDGVCCPEGTIAWQSNFSAAILWSCLEPEG